MIRLSFTVHGPPVPKARARIVSRVECGKTRTRGVTPQKTRDYEKMVSLVALAKRQNFDASMHAAGIRDGVPSSLVSQMQKRWPCQDKAKRYGIKLHVYRSRDAGDLDNYVKAISDACNGVLWLDDSQIRMIDAMVDGCEKGRERVEVEVWTLD